MVSPFERGFLRETTVFSEIFAEISSNSPRRFLDRFPFFEAWGTFRFCGVTPWDPSRLFGLFGVCGGLSKVVIARKGCVTPL